MRKFFVVVLFGLGLGVVSAKAQAVTNITISITVQHGATGEKTNTATITPGTASTKGFVLYWQKAQIAATLTTNTPPNFQSSIKDALQEKVKELGENYRVYERQQAQLDAILARISETYNQFSNADKAALSNLSLAYPQP